MNYLYEVGEKIEARTVETNKWSPAVVVALKPYRNKPGYDIRWTVEPHSEAERRAKDLPMPSSGGWSYEAVMRKITVQR